MSNAIKAGTIFNQVHNVENDVIGTLIELEKEGYTKATDARRTYFKLLEELAQLTHDTRQ